MCGERRNPDKSAEETHDHEITRLLAAYRSGEPQAEDDLVLHIYERLRGIASRLMAAERTGHTIQPTALVNEVFLRLRKQIPTIMDRRQLYAAARTGMRRFLIDYARQRAAQKRTPETRGHIMPPHNELIDPWYISLTAALEELRQLDSRQFAVVEYRFLVGLTVEETAEQLDVSRSTVEKDWRLARAWLYCKLGGSSGNKRGVE